jgi:hypothetical protein
MKIYVDNCRCVFAQLARNGPKLRRKLWFMAANLLYRLGEINLGSIAAGEILGLGRLTATKAGRERRNTKAGLHLC